MSLKLKSCIPGLCPEGDPAASLENIKRQSTRSKVSYSAGTTLRHLHLSRWDRLENYRKPFDGAHFGHAQRFWVAVTAP